MKLNIELVPSSTWYDNVRSQVTATQWKKLRELVLAEHGNQCSVCGNAKRLAAHEVWAYSESTATQTLTGMVALCPMCHHIKHIGLAQLLASQGKLNYASVVNHYCSINKCSRKDFEQHVDEAFRQWSARNEKTWKVDTGLLDAKYASALVIRKPKNPGAGKEASKKENV